MTFTDNALTSTVDRIITGWLVSSCPSVLSRNVYKSDLAHFGSYLKELGRNLLEINRQGSALIEKPIHDYMIWNIVKKYARKAGLQVDRLDVRGICAHSTRVSSITASFEGGAKLEEIQQIDGHKDPRNTLRYRRLSSKDAVNAVMRISFYFFVKAFI